MTDRPPFVSVTKTLIRINATAVVELLPEEIIPETHDMILELKDNATRLEIGFVKQNEAGEGAYAMHPRSGGYHTNTSTVRNTILWEHDVGRYACKWDSEKERLIVDLTTKAMGT